MPSLARTIEVTKTALTGGTFIKYFNSVTNVGDRYNVDIVRYFTGKDPCPLPGRLHKLKHFIIVGSIIEHASESSVVLGAGSNQPNRLEKIDSFGVVRVVRGEFTRELVNKKRQNRNNDIFLGDPGLLISRIYPNAKDLIEYEFGVILHYADRHPHLENFFKKLGALIIHVDQNAEKFSEQICKCRCILSSSLHGVIFADSYGIPNVRCVFSDKITGANFKFEDYYSTTYRNPKHKYEFKGSLNAKEVLSAISQCQVAEYRYSLPHLESVLRNSLTNRA